MTIGTAERWALEYDSAENPGSTGSMGDADAHAGYHAEDARWEDGWVLSYTADFAGHSYRAVCELGIVSYAGGDSLGRRYFVAERDYIERDDDLWEMGDCQGGYIAYAGVDGLDAAKREMSRILAATRSFWQHADVSDLGKVAA